MNGNQNKFQGVKSSFFKKAMKFAIIGFSGIFIDYGITIFTKEILYFSPYLANALGFMVAAVSNFYLNKFWTFKNKNGNTRKELGIFILIAIIGLLINSFIIWLLFEYNTTLPKFITNTLTLPQAYVFYCIKFIAIVIVFFWNFLLNNFFNFQQE